MKNNHIVASRFISVAVSFSFLFAVQHLYGDEISIEFFRTFSLVSLVSIGWLISLPIVNTRVYASSGRGAYRVKEIVCIYRDFVLLAVLGIATSTLYLIFYFSGEEIGDLLYAYILMPMLMAYSRLLISSLNIGKNFILAILIDGPVFFVSSFLALFFIKDLMCAKLASILSVFFGFLMVAIIARFILHYTAGSKQEFEYYKGPLKSKDLMFITGNGFIRNFFDNIVPVYAPTIFSDAISAQLLIVWKLGAVLLIPLKAIQAKLAVSCAELINNKEAFGPQYFAFIKYTLGASVLLALLLFAGWAFGVLNMLVGVDISLGYLAVVVVGFLMLNVVGPGGVVCELSGMGRHLFCLQSIVFCFAFYFLSYGSFTAYSFLGFVFLLIGFYESVALGLAYKEQVSTVN